MSQLKRVVSCVALLMVPLNPTLAESQISRASTRPSEVYDSCMVCHSTREMQRGPILDGLPSWYVMHQLSKFKQGIRGAKEQNKSEFLMHAVVKQYDKPIIWKELAAHIESLPAPDHLKLIRGNPERGKVLFAVCSSCHGAQGQGNQSLKAPPLNVQEDWYLMEQLRKYQTGMRGYDVRDIEGRLMQSIVRLYSLQDLKDIVAFITRTAPPKNTE
jgi:cytochrome c553